MKVEKGRYFEQKEQYGVKIGKVHWVLKEQQVLRNPETKGFGFCKSSLC